MLAAGVIGAIVLAASACGQSYGSGDPAGPPAAVAVNGVVVKPQVAQLLTIGETRQLTATVSPLDATDRAVTWESTDPTVASVDANGVVTARSRGVGVFVTALTHDGHFQASVNVAVQP
jgi:uncharacterized protein YjdB